MTRRSAVRTTTFLPSQIFVDELDDWGDRVAVREIDVIDIKELPGGEANVQVFFGIDGPISSCNIDWNWSILAGRISDWLLPIACDSFGNIFCISFHDKDYGSVVYCDFEPNAHLGGAIYYRVAPDFDSFLERIRSLESN